MKPPPSSDPHEHGGPSSNENMTIALITDCPTINVHTGKYYKTLMDSGQAVSLIRYSIYQNIDDNLKTAIESTLIHLNMANGSPMTALGINTLQIQRADSKFSHNFIICDRLLDIEILFGIDLQKKFTLSYAWD